MNAVALHLAERGRGAPRLYAEGFAPWCEKARWALDHHGVAYRWREHVPLAGEVPLRFAARRWRGRVTVPLLVADGLVLMNSFEIARYAERVGCGAALFPVRHEGDIEHWNTHSEALMVVGRAMLLRRILGHPAALREQLPPAVPQWLRPALAGVAITGVKFLMRKYGVDQRADAQPEAAARQELDELRRALQRGSGHLVGDRLSFADITMATALQFIVPVADRCMPLGPATREAWTHHELAGPCADLLDWRDRLYASHRNAVPQFAGLAQGQET